jgi:hypothetical protein
MESILETTKSMEKIQEIFRVSGQWYRISPKPYESEKQTWFIASKLCQGHTQLESYKLWYSERQKEAKLLYPDFRK